MENALLSLYRMMLIPIFIYISQLYMKIIMYIQLDPFSNNR